MSCATPGNKKRITVGNETSYRENLPLAGGTLFACPLGKPRLGDERPPNPSCLVQPCRLPQASSAASVQVSNQERSYQESFRVEREQAERTRTCTAQDQFAKEVSHQDVCGDRRGGILRQGRGGGQAVRDLPQRLPRVPLQRERDLAHLRSGRGEDDRALCKLFRSRPSRCGPRHTRLTRAFPSLSSLLGLQSFQQDWGLGPNGLERRGP